MVTAKFVDNTVASFYTKEVLAQGHTLSHLIAKHFDLMEWQAVSFVPEDLPDAAMNKFNFGSNLPSKVIRKAVSDWVVELLTGCSYLALIVENALAQPSDLWLSSTHVNTIVFENEVYHYCSIPEAEAVQTKDTFSEVVSKTITTAENAYPPVVGVVSARNDRLCVRPEGKFSVLEREELVTIATNACHIIVGAYDGEGYLIWHWANECQSLYQT